MDIITAQEKNKLRNKCIPVMKEKTSYLNNLINNMTKLMIENRGCGIAAPQVGVNKRLFITILDDERLELFLNPAILEYSKETEVGTEGCLSIPGKCGDVERSKRIKIEYFNGKEAVVKEYEGMNARIIQHEYDHLKGILYIDKASNVRDIEITTQEKIK